MALRTSSRRKPGRDPDNHASVLPRIIALTGQKGGVGKTTIAVHLAAEAAARGRRVLLVDADKQGTARTWGAVASESGYETPPILSMYATMHRPDQLPRIAESYDLVVVDCPGRSDEIQRSALMVADLALLPCGPSGADTWALAASLDLVAEAQALRESLRASIVITKKKSHTAIGRAARDALVATGRDVLATELHDRVAYQEALTAGKGVTSYAPRDPAAEEIRSLHDELFGRGKKGNR